MKKKKFSLSKNSLANLEGVKEEIIELIKRSIKKVSHDFGIPSDGGWRSKQDQYRLFMKVPAVTKLDGITNLSRHQSGEAFDIFVYDEHGACWKCKFKYKEIADVIKEEFKLMKEEGIFNEGDSIEWGGDWRWIDLPHFQINYKK